MNKTYSKVAFSLIAVAILFAIISALRENWSANERPGAVETFLARLFLSRSRGADSGVKNPVEPTAANLDEGRLLYEKQCAFCHGLDGKGQGTTGLQFYPPVPPLAGSDQKERSDGRMQAILNNGIRYTAMPSFVRELSQEEIWKVVLWVRRLAEQAPAASNTTSDGTQQK